MGTQNSNADNIIKFPNGLIGLAEQTQLQLFHETTQDEPVVHWLQSIEDADFSMSVISPSTLGMEYEIEFSDDDLKSLQLDNPADALVLLVVYKQSDENNDIKVVTTAPIIINADKNLGPQKSLDQAVFH
ncbi:MAG: flagellar assembly protein FliW [Methylophaga sp.]|nr:flagellar assembly protein FliW [Methylophaga sp.]